jgi:hypothetical protein
MPLDILGRTRATMACAESLFEVRLGRTSRLAWCLAAMLGIGRRKSTQVIGPRETVVERLRQS